MTALSPRSAAAWRRGDTVPYEQSVSIKTALRAARSACEAGLRVTGGAHGSDFSLPDGRVEGTCAKTSMERKTLPSRQVRAELTPSWGGVYSTDLESRPARDKIRNRRGQSFEDFRFA